MLIDHRLVQQTVRQLWSGPPFLRGLHQASLLLEPKRQLCLSPSCVQSLPNRELVGLARADGRPVAGQDATRRSARRPDLSRPPSPSRRNDPAAIKSKRSRQQPAERRALQSAKSIERSWSSYVARAVAPTAERAATDRALCESRIKHDHTLSCFASRAKKLIQIAKVPELPAM